MNLSDGPPSILGAESCGISKDDFRIQGNSFIYLRAQFPKRGIGKSRRPCPCCEPICLSPDVRPQAESIIRCAFRNRA
jgi:hypothetical protein